MKTYILLIAFLWGLSVNAQRILDSTNYPKRYDLKEFKLSQTPFEWNKNTKLDTNAVYIRTLDSVFVQVVGKKVKMILFTQQVNDSYASENILKYKQKGIPFFNKVYIVYRYFGDGVMFSSFPYASEPSETECNDLEYGIYAPYNFIRESDIITEELTPNTLKMKKTERTFYYYRIMEDYTFISSYSYRLNGQIHSEMNEKGEYDYYEHKKKVRLYNFKVKPRF